MKNLKIFLLTALITFIITICNSAEFIKKYVGPCPDWITPYLLSLF